MKINKIKTIAIALYESTKDLKGPELGKALHNFVALLAKENYLGQAEKIIAAFIAYAKKQECIEEIEISTARKIEAKLLHAIRDAFGEKVESTETVDSTLIGGLVIKTKDTIFDASLKKQLTKLKEKLIS